MKSTPDFPPQPIKKEGDAPGASSTAMEDAFSKAKEVKLLKEKKQETAFAESVGEELTKELLNSDVDTRIVQQPEEQSHADFWNEWNEANRVRPAYSAVEVKPPQPSSVPAETPIIPNPEDALDQRHVQEIASEDHTPKEWRDTLRELVDKLEVANKILERGKKDFEWYKSSEEHLIRRNEELDAQVEKLGGVERWFRAKGEAYNKLPFKYKLALGASLGLGTAATAGTLAVALPLLGIAGQRALGLATMYLKFEKNSHDEKWGKEKALLAAGAYTVLLGLTMKEAIEYVSQTELAHTAQSKVEGWLGAVLGHHAAAPEADLNLPQEVIDSNHAAIMKGWNDFNPGKPFPGYEAASEDINKHLMALNEQGFSVQNSPQEAVGKITPAPVALPEIPAHEEVSYKPIPPYHEAAAHVAAGVAQPAPEALPEIQPYDEPPLEPLKESNLYYGNPAEAGDLASNPPPPPSTVVPLPAHLAGLQPSQAEVFIRHLDAQQPTVTAEVAYPPIVEIPHVPEPVVEVPVAPVEAPAPEPPLEQATLPEEPPMRGITTVPETTVVPNESPSLAIEHAQEFINQNNLPIDPLRGHIFQDQNGSILSYGNDFDARFNAAQEYVQSNRDTAVWVQAEKPVFYENEWRPWVFQIKYSGFWPFGSVQAVIPSGLPDLSQIGNVNPDTFIKQVDK